MKAALHAAALLSWLLCGAGAATAWDARSTAPGGFVPHTPLVFGVGVALIAVGAVAAVLLHGIAFFAPRRGSAIARNRKELP